MRDAAPNHYERAFEHWLIDHKIEYVRADERKRLGPAQRSVKNFDFLLTSGAGRQIVIEVKGRTFKGASVAELKGFECWVTRDDVRSLQMWQQALGLSAAIVFAYRIAHVDVDLDGRQALTVGQDRYLFLAIPIDDYAEHMKRRSPKWRTVTLPAVAFRELAVDPESLL